MSISDAEIERQFDDFITKNSSRFSSIGDKHKEVIKDLISEYHGKPKASDNAIRRDTHQLWQNRREMGLKSKDIQMIRDLLASSGDN